MTDAWGQVPETVHVVSVDPDFTQALQLMDAVKGLNLVVWNVDHPIPIAHPYECPETLGVDRLLVALAARVLHPGANVIVVDAGTAVTIDLVLANGSLAGGAIAPGLSALGAALAGAGRQLPEVDLQKQVPYPGVSTASCLNIGIRAAFEGALQGLVRVALQRVDEAKIVVTGGDIEAAANALKQYEVEQEADLIHIGFQELERVHAGTN
jgi:pantothenate kinase type III